MGKKRVSFTGVFSGVTKVTVKTEMLTKSTAEHMLLTMPYSRQRPPRNVSAGAFNQALDEGYFYPGSVISLARVGKKSTIIDGQHRLSSIHETGVDTLVVIKTYYCKSMLQVNRLYVLFDSGIGVRSKADMFVALYGQRALTKIPKKMVARLVSASRTIANCFSQGYARVQAYHVLMILHCAKSFLSPMLKFLKVTEGATGPLRRETLLSQSVLSVALATMEWQPVLANEFWDGVTHNGVKTKNDPRQPLRELLNQLQTASPRNVFNHRKGAQRFTPCQISHIVAWCWNHFYNKKQMASLEAEAAATNGPILIEGTPFSLPLGSKEFAEATKAYGIGGSHALNVQKYVNRSSTTYKEPKASAEVKVRVAVS